MALGNHANYGKVGFTVILGVVALVASLVFIRPPQELMTPSIIAALAILANALKEVLAK